jgi:hypothetical protein
VWDKEWFSMYEKIQAAGKCLVLHGLHSIEDVLKVCENTSPTGLWLNIELKTEAQAEELLERVNRLN